MATLLASRALAIGLAVAGLSGCVGASPPPVAPTVVVVGRVAGGAPEAAKSAPVVLGRGADDGHAAGDLVDVEWHGSWYPAVLLERRSEGWLVHYEDFGTEWDEVASPARIRPRSYRIEESSDGPDDDAP